jgi:hypothetical protein
MRQLVSLPREDRALAMREGWYMPGGSGGAKRLLKGAREYWMIGYDGPSPQPGSWWPRMMEHAQRYGL